MTAPYYVVRTGIIVWGLVYEIEAAGGYIASVILGGRNGRKEGQM